MHVWYFVLDIKLSRKRIVKKVLRVVRVYFVVSKQHVKVV